MYSKSSGFGVGGWGIWGNRAGWGIVLIAMCDRPVSIPSSRTIIINHGMMIVRDDDDDADGYCDDDDDHDDDTWVTL